MERRTPLKRTPFKRKPAKRTNEFHPSVRAQIEARSGGRCEAGAPGCRGAAAHIHHIKLRSQGGDGDIANGLHVCLTCHNWIHAHPAASAERGWLNMRRAG